MGNINGAPQPTPEVAPAPSPAATTPPQVEHQAPALEMVSLPQVQLAASTIANPTEMATTWWERILQRLAAGRDGVLTIAGLIYISGFLLWSYTAWHNKLGLLPVMQIQYFAAGLIPILLLLFFIIANILRMMLYYAIRQPIVKLSEKEYHRLCKIIYFGVIFIFIALIAELALILIDIKEKPHSTPSPFSAFTSLYGIYIGTVMGALTYGERRDLGSFSDYIRRTNLKGLLFESCINIFMLFSVTQLFLLSLYPQIPQEFGGPKPRNAYIDLKWGDVSRQTRSSLLPKESLVQAVEIRKDKVPSAFRSVELDVYFSGSDYLLVRTHGASSDTPVIQVKKDTVQSVEWTGEY